MQRKSYTKNFSLIELLITIAIISILAGLLLPALNRARTKAVAIQCASNLRQTTAAMLAYAFDHDSTIALYLPTSATSSYLWSRRLYSGNYLKHPVVMHCPARTKPSSVDPAAKWNYFSLGSWPNVTYGLAGYQLGNDAFFTGKRQKTLGKFVFSVTENGVTFARYLTTRMTRPSLTFAIADTWGMKEQQDYGNFTFRPCNSSPNGNIGFNHAQSLNLSFFDGHVQAVTRQELIAAGFTKAVIGGVEMDIL